MQGTGAALIECKNVSIVYPSGDFRETGLKEYIIKRLSGQYRVEKFYADRDISFSLFRGDMLGIIGTNGAGKSTLLKAVSGILIPSSGYIKSEGRIAALLELGSGFDGELSVKENTFLRGALLGYTKEFMLNAYNEIIDFAELQDVEDRQFKHLSSGMRSRLAFSIASHVDPDILILDEVLSVGDGAFRRKSEEKMLSLINGNRSTILVSHSTEQVKKICNKILWLDKGRQIAFGCDTEKICSEYERFLKTKKLPSASKI